jgi:hypothetical protein
MPHASLIALSIMLRHMPHASHSSQRCHLGKVPGWLRQCHMCPILIGMQATHRKINQPTGALSAIHLGRKRAILASISLLDAALAFLAGGCSDCGPGSLELELGQEVDPASGPSARACTNELFWATSSSGMPSSKTMPSLIMRFSKKFCRLRLSSTMSFWMRASSSDDSSHRNCRKISKEPRSMGFGPSTCKSRCLMWADMAGAPHKAGCVAPAMVLSCSKIKKLEHLW